MTEIQIFAFVILPLIVAALGWMIAVLYDRSARREREREGLR